MRRWVWVRFARFPSPGLDVSGISFVRCFVESLRRESRGAEVEGVVGRSLQVLVAWLPSELVKSVDGGMGRARLTCDHRQKALHLQLFAYGPLS